MSKFVCPSCKQSFAERGPAFPFCSARCKLLDLGAWATGQYRIEGKAIDPEELKNEQESEDAQEN